MKILRELINPFRVFKEILEENKKMRNLLTAFIKVWDEDSTALLTGTEILTNIENLLRNNLTKQEELFTYMGEYFRLETEQLRKFTKEGKIKPTEDDLRF